MALLLVWSCTKLTAAALLTWPLSFMTNKPNFQLKPIFVAHSCKQGTSSSSNCRQCNVAHTCLKGPWLVSSFMHTRKTPIASHR